MRKNGAVLLVVGGLLAAFAVLKGIERRAAQVPPSQAQTPSAGSPGQAVEPAPAPAGPKTYAPLPEVAAPTDCRGAFARDPRLYAFEKLPASAAARVRADGLNYYFCQALQTGLNSGADFEKYSTPLGSGDEYLNLLFTSDFASGKLAAGQAPCVEFPKWKVLLRPGASAVEFCSRLGNIIAARDKSRCGEVAGLLQPRFAGVCELYFTANSAFCAGLANEAARSLCQEQMQASEAIVGRQRARCPDNGVFSSACAAATGDASACVPALKRFADTACTVGEDHPSLLKKEDMPPPKVVAPPPQQPPKKGSDAERIIKNSTLDFPPPPGKRLPDPDSVKPTPRPKADNPQ